jgi:3-methyladenine DNA glycosylase AlkD
MLRPSLPHPKCWSVFSFQSNLRLPEFGIKRAPKKTSQSMPKPKTSSPKPPRKRWTKSDVLAHLQSLADPQARASMAHFGIDASNAHGITTPVLQKLAKQIGKDHDLALELWSSKVHEAQILATFIGEPVKVTAAEMERWVKDFNSWDLVDGSCRYLYSDAPELAWKKAHAWSTRKPEFEKRAAFSLAAYLSYRDKSATNAQFFEFLRIIEREAYDERNFVKKAVNWALRQIGKRNLVLNREAIRCAERIREQGSSSARWIAADALRELKSEAVQKRLRQKRDVKRWRRAGKQVH